MSRTTAIIGLCLLLVAVQSEEDSEITKHMISLQIIPDVIEKGPKNELKITYNKELVVDKGNEVTPSQVQHEPKVEWTPESNTYYMLTMTNPDAPCHNDPKLGEWDHWLVGNIPGNDTAKGEMLAQYVGALPPESSGLHRYVFLLFKQPKKLEFNEDRLSNHSAKGRGQFSTKKFVQKYGLGTPIAGNFFRAQYDNYVLEVYKQLFTVD